MKVGDTVTFAPELVAQGCPARVVITDFATSEPDDGLTERQRDQQFIERQRADYLSRANAVSTPDEPIDPEWDGVKL